jgi:hypothetical protein
MLEARIAGALSAREVRVRRRRVERAEGARALWSRLISSRGAWTGDRAGEVGGSLFAHLGAATPGGKAARRRSNMTIAQ